MGFSQNVELLMENYSRNDFLPKTKMVRMVHRNLFYELGLEIDDPKSELGTKSKILEVSNILKNWFWGPKFVFWGGWQRQNHLKNTCRTIRHHFGLISIYNIFILNEFRGFFAKIRNNRVLIGNPSLLSPLRGAYWYKFCKRVEWKQHKQASHCRGWQGHPGSQIHAYHTSLSPGRSTAGAVYYMPCFHYWCLAFAMQTVT